MPDEVQRVESFSRIMKLEPFERGMRELAPKVWITALRKEQNPQRAASLKTVMWDTKFNCLKVNPILEWTATEMDAYLTEHNVYRCMHGVPLMTWDAKIEQIAQRWADRGQMQHGGMDARLWIDGVKRLQDRIGVQCEAQRGGLFQAQSMVGTVTP